MEYIKIGDLTTVVTGGTPSTSVHEYWDDGNVPWLQSGCCQNCDVIDTEKYITQSGYDNSSTKMMPPDTVMIALTGATAGKVGYLKFDACGNQSITGILPCESVDQRYLFYYLMSQRSKILSDCIGGAQPHISQGYVKDFVVPVLPISEQRDISRKLCMIDELIETRNQQILKLDELVKSRFIEMFGDVPEAEHTTMPEVCSIITDGTHQPPKFVSSGIPFLFVSNIVTNKITYNAEKFISEETYKELMKRTPIEIGDILLSTVGSYGHPAVVETDRPFSFQRHIAYLKPKKDVINSIYLYGALLSADVQKQIDERVKGIAQKTLNLSEIRKLHFPLPSMEVQNQFATFVEQTDKLKFEVKEALEKLETLKKSLMQQYFG